MTIRAHGHLAPSRSSASDGWAFRPKMYPHFDSFLNETEARALASDPARVAAHTFYPFILYHQRWTKFTAKGTKGKVKERPIRFAARADAYIFSYYRHLLSAPFEARLKELDLGDSVLAYRRIASPGGGGKCNIHFALDAVNAIRKLGNCSAIALDISSFFESLDHEMLRARWCDLLKVSRLPPDHYAVFKAMTRYSVIDREELYERLGYWGQKHVSRDGVQIKGFLVDESAIPLQLCNGTDFRQNIAGGNGQRSLIEVHRKPYGIPQGSPISDLLANFYLMQFDRIVATRVRELGGIYFRYSDDILIVAPIEPDAAIDLEAWVRQEIVCHGPKLQIKAEKSAIFRYWGTGGDQTWIRIAGEQGKNGIEYLGFRYDGNSMFLRDSTLSGLQRKAASSATRLALSLVQRYPGKSSSDILTDVNLSSFLQRYGRVHDFESKADNVKNWTFWTYATKAASITAPLGLPIFKQLRNYRRNMRNHVKRALEKKA